MSATTASGIERAVPSRTLARLRLPQRWGAAAGLAELGVALAAGLAMMWPVTTSLTSRIVGSGDAEYYLWLGWRLAGLMRAGQVLPVTIPDVVYPYGNSLLLGDGYLPEYVGGLLNLVLSPIAAYNAALLVFTLLNFWAARRLARLLTTSRLMALVAALAFTTTPLLLARLQGHFTLYLAFTAPLLIESALRKVVYREPVHPVRLGILFFVAFLCSVYYLLFGAIAYGVIVVAGSGGLRRLAGQVARMAAATVLCTLLMSPFLVARLQMDAAERAHGASALASVQMLEAFYYSGSANSLFVAPGSTYVRLPLLMPGFPDGQEGVTLFAGTLLLLGLASLCVLRTRARWPLVAGAAVVLLLVLGPTLRVNSQALFTTAVGSPIYYLPYAVLLSVPGLAHLRDPNRASFQLLAIMTACLALGLDAMWRGGGRWRRALVLVGCAALLATNLGPSRSIDFETTPASEAAMARVAADADGRASVLMVPADCTDRQIEEVKLQVFYRHPAVGCQGDTASIPFYSGYGRYLDSHALAALSCKPGRVSLATTSFTSTPELASGDLSSLREQLGVRYAIIDLKRLGDPGCAAVRANAGTLTQGRVLGGDGLWQVVDLAPLQAR